MCEQVRNSEFQSTQQLNEVLAQELQYVIDLRQSENQNKSQTTTISHDHEPDHNHAGLIDTNMRAESVDAECPLPNRSRRGITEQSIIPKTKTSEPVNIKCLKCNKNGMTRAAICELGNH